MPKLRTRSRLVCGLVVYLVIVLTPTPILLSWFFTGSSAASASVEEKRTPDRRKPPITDMAPPQPLLAADASDAPGARLARLGLEPKEFSLEDQRKALAASGLDFANEAEMRKFQLNHLTRQLGSEARARAAMAELEKPLARTPVLHSPELAPRIPDPFEPLPAQAPYERARRHADRR